MKKRSSAVIMAMLLAAAVSLSGCGAPAGVVQDTPSESTPVASAVTSTAQPQESAQSEATQSGEDSTPAADNGDYSYQKNSDGSIAMNYGAILHAWSWSLKTITDNLQDIKDAGYTSIQTSPINECKVGEDGGMELSAD